MTVVTGLQRPLIWLASYPKSGNTWLRLLLRAIDAESDASWQELQFRGDEVIASSRELVQRATGFIASELVPDDADSLRSLAYRRLAATATQKVFIKAHDRYDSAAIGAIDFPQELTAAIIYLVRNPLDVVPSFSHHLGISIDQCIALLENEDAALGGGRNGDPEQFRQQLGSWSQHVHGWTTPQSSSLTVVRYEDLMRDTAAVLDRVLGSIGRAGLPTSRLEEAVSRCRFERLQANERREGFGDRSPAGRPFFRSGRIGEWREVLTPDQVQRILRKHGPVMRSMGYDTSECSLSGPGD